MSQRLLIWNSNSGRADTAATLHEWFPTHSTSFIDVCTESDLTSVISLAVERGCDTVIAAGGDGTINSVVNALMAIAIDSRPRLGIIPLGTANDLARTLGIPASVETACELIERDNRLQVDVVRIRNQKIDRFFINVATGGNGSRVSEAITDETKATWGAFCYLRGAIAVLTDLVSFRVNLDCDEETFEGIDAWAILVANGKSNAGHIVIAPEASVTDGLLDLIIVLDGTAIDMVKIAASVMQGNFLESDQVVYRKAKRCSLTSTPSMKFTLDGEVVDDANAAEGNTIQFEVVPNALSIVVGELA